MASPTRPDKKDHICTRGLKRHVHIVDFVCLFGFHVAFKFEVISQQCFHLQNFLQIRFHLFKQTTLLKRREYLIDTTQNFIHYEVFNTFLNIQRRHLFILIFNNYNTFDTDQDSHLENGAAPQISIPRL